MRVVYHPAAVEELVQAAQFYDAKVAGLGADFLDEVDRVIGDLINAPQRHAVVQGDARRCMLRRFPYGLYYRQVGGDLRILAIKHHSRHPDYGLDRT